MGSGKVRQKFVGEVVMDGRQAAEKVVKESSGESPVLEKNGSVSKETVFSRNRRNRIPLYRSALSEVQGHDRTLSLSADIHFLYTLSFTVDLCRICLTRSSCTRDTLSLTGPSTVYISRACRIHRSTWPIVPRGRSAPASAPSSGFLCIYLLRN